MMGKSRCRKGVVKHRWFKLIWPLSEWEGHSTSSCLFHCWGWHLPTPGPPGAAFLLVSQRVGHFCMGPQRSFSRTFTSNLICPINCPQTRSLTLHFCHHIKRHSWASLGLSDEESTCQCSKHESDHWSGKIPRVVEPLNLCAAVTEPVL